MRGQWASINVWDRFLKFLTFCVFDDGPLGPHKCENFDCCKGYDPKVTHNRAVMSIVDLLWGCTPLKPEKGKWTKLGPCLDWHMVRWIMGIFRKSTPSHSRGSA